MASRLEFIRAAGIVGCGGAGFPTHVKLAANAEHLIINAMECEPLLRSDRFVMTRFAPQLVEAATALAAETGAKQCTFALKQTYHAEIKALEAAIRMQNAPVALHMVPSFYPAGDEQVVVHEITGRTVPPGAIPAAVGCVVLNVGTLLAAYEAFSGAPMTKRYVTVSGAMKEPCVVLAPIGTPFSDCLTLAGGPETGEPVYVISGGPMMGKCFEMDNLDTLFVGKTTSGILLLPKAQYHFGAPDWDLVRRQTRAACIQCSYCTQLCPRQLLGHPLEPHRIMRALAYQTVDEALTMEVVQNAALCCECGVCETYACPMGILPRQVNALLKQELAARGIRRKADTQSTQPDTLRTARRVPSERIAARAGVFSWYEQPVQTLRTASPQRVRLALRQGIGVAAEPLVSPGDVVSVGQCIAWCPDGKLGAHLHASMAGCVTAVDDAIQIER